MMKCPIVAPYFPIQIWFVTMIRLGASATSAQACGGLEDPRNADCAEGVQWAFEKGLKQHPGRAL